MPTSDVLKLLRQLSPQELPPADLAKLSARVSKLHSVGEVWIDNSDEPDTLLNTAIGMRNPTLVRLFLKAGCPLSPDTPEALMDPDTPAASSPLLAVCFAVQVLLSVLENSDEKALSDAMEVLEELVKHGADVLETDFVLFKSAWEEWLAELEQAVDVTDRLDEALKISQLLLGAQGEEKRAAFSEALLSGSQNVPEAVAVMQIPLLGDAWRAQCKKEALERELTPAPAPSRGPRL